MTGITEEPIILERIAEVSERIGWNDVFDYCRRCDYEPQDARKVYAWSLKELEEAVAQSRLSQEFRAKAPSRAETLRSVEPYQIIAACPEHYDGLFESAYSVRDSSYRTPDFELEFDVVRGIVGDSLVWFVHKPSEPMFFVRKAIDGGILIYDGAANVVDGSSVTQFSKSEAALLGIPLADFRIFGMFKSAWNIDGLYNPDSNWSLPK